MTIQEVTGKTASEYFVRLDALVAPGTVLYVYGGAAVALLGSGIRTTMDVDVAEPYSHFDRTAFAVASAQAGLPVNPGIDHEAAFLELVGAFREDALVLENLGNLERDMKMWGVGTC